MWDQGTKMKAHGDQKVSMLYLRISPCTPIDSLPSPRIGDACCGNFPLSVKFLANGWVSTHRLWASDCWSQTEWHAGPMKTTLFFLYLLCFLSTLPKTIPTLALVLSWVWVVLSSRTYFFFSRNLTLEAKDLFYKYEASDVIAYILFSMGCKWGTHFKVEITI